MGTGMFDNIIRDIVGFIVFCAVALAVVAGGGAVGGYMLAASLGAGKAMTLAAAGMSAIAAPFAAGGAWMGVSKWNKHRKDKKRQAQQAAFRASYAASAKQTPAPAPAPVVQPTVAPKPSDDTPPVFVDALAKMKEMAPDDRKKYLDRLRDAFPDEVETLHKYNDGMALAHDAPTMKKLTLVKPSNSGNTP